MIIIEEVKLDFNDVLITPKRSTLISRKDAWLARKFKLWQWQSGRRTTKCAGVRLVFCVGVADRQRRADPVAGGRRRQLLELDGVVALRDRLALAIAIGRRGLGLPLLPGDTDRVRRADAVRRRSRRLGLVLGALARLHGRACLRRHAPVEAHRAVRHGP